MKAGFPKEDLEVSEKPFKNFSVALVIGEVQIKSTVSFRLMPVRTAKVNQTNDSSHWREGGVKGAPLHCWWECKLTQPLWKSVWWFLREMGISLLQLLSCTLSSKSLYIPLLGHSLNHVHCCSILIARNCNNLDTCQWMSG